MFSKSLDESLRLWRIFNANTCTPWHRPWFAKQIRQVCAMCKWYAKRANFANVWKISRSLLFSHHSR